MSLFARETRAQTRAQYCYQHFKSRHLFSLKVDRPKVRDFELLDFNKPAIMPKAKFIEVLVKDISTNIDGITRFNIRELEVNIFNGYRRIAINIAFNA